MATLVTTDSTRGFRGPRTSMTLVSTNWVNESVTSARVPMGVFKYTYTKLGSPVGKKAILTRPLFTERPVSTKLSTSNPTVPNIM